MSSILPDALGYTPRIGVSTGIEPHERGHYLEPLRRALADGYVGIELSALSLDELQQLEDALQDEDVQALLDECDFISIHGPAKDLRGSKASWDQLSDRLLGLPSLVPVVMHPDAVPAHAFDALTRLEKRLVIENMDFRKQWGKATEDLHVAFARVPEARLCLDVAHAFSVDPTLALGHLLVDEFGDRLCQIHLSGIASNGKHRKLTEADLLSYKPVLDRCKHLPWILESRSEV